MVYEPTTWTDETPASSPVKYKITDDSKGEVVSSAIIEPVTEISEGTPLSAANLNHIEAGVLENYRRSSRIIAAAGSGLTIASGAITVDLSSGNGFFVVSNESDAVMDDLVTITGGSNGDVIALLMTNDQRATLKNGSGNILTPGNVDYVLTENLITLLRFNGTAWYVVGGGSENDDSPKNSVSLALTTSYQELVAAPSGGTRVVSEILLTNEDDSITTSFYIKIVRSSVDYLVIEKVLAPGDTLHFRNLMFSLSSTDSIQVKVGASLTTGRACAGYTNSLGAMEMVNFTGASFTDALTVPTGKTYKLKGWAICNTYTTTQVVALKIIDASSNILLLRKKTLRPNESWFSQLDFFISAGYKVQVAHGAASCTGSVVVSYLEA